MVDVLVMGVVEVVVVSEVVGDVIIEVVSNSAVVLGMTGSVDVIAGDSGGVVVSVIVSAGVFEEAGSEEVVGPPHDRNDKNMTSVITITKQRNTKIDTIVLF